MAFTNQHLLFISFALVLLLGLLEAPTLARPLEHQKAISMRERHELWMAKHERVYNDLKEKETRFNIFKQNVELIENFNANASSDKSYKLGVNAFADLTNAEFIATHSGYKKRLHSEFYNGTNGIKYDVSLSDDLPDSLDWREKGAVTDVKYQWKCACCWAFTTVAAVEGLNFINTNQLISLSEQQLVDCVTSSGCNKGYMVDAFAYIQQSQGLVTEDMYPYQGIQGQCQLTSNGGVKINGFQTVPPNDEDALKQAVSRQPVSVGIDGSGYDFMNYKGGVYDENCGNSMNELNHAVTIIGYGTDTTTRKDYWLVKNSWGETWGENGYMRIARGQNQCGISLAASYPI